MLYINIVGEVYMKNKLDRILLMIFIIPISLLIIDFLQSYFLRRSPIISKHIYYIEKNYWVDEGIFFDVYHCVYDGEKNDLKWKLKNSKYVCPIPKNLKLINFNFSVNVGEKEKKEKIFLFMIDDVKFYYDNSDFMVFITSNGRKYSLEQALLSKSISLQDILNKSSKINYDNKDFILYYYDNFGIKVYNGDKIHTVIFYDLSMDSL